jgi:hypothetical protein
MLLRRGLDVALGQGLSPSFQSRSMEYCPRFVAADRLPLSPSEVRFALAVLFASRPRRSFPILTSRVFPRDGLPELNKNSCQ